MTTPQTTSPRWFDVGDGRVRLLRDGREAFPAMLAAIEAAESEILLEMYWIGADAVGTRFRDALVARARAGVTVRVVYDAVGSLSITPAFWRELELSGGEAREYHPLSPLRPSFDISRVELRDHRKVLVVDGRIGFVGGLNLAAPWLPPEEGGEGWRDDVLETRSVAAAELRTLFYKTWRRLRLLERLPDVARAPKDLAPLTRYPTSRVYVLASQRRSRRNLRREYLTRLNRATRSIDIANSYFLPDRHGRAALQRAVLRGVRVRVLVPSKSDVAVVQFAIEAMYDDLLRHGIEIYSWRGPMMHAKTAIIDDAFVTIGSYNLDERSRKKNLELNVVVEDRAFTEHVRGWFERDLANADRIDLYEWRARPILRRGLEAAAHALRRLW